MSKRVTHQERPMFSKRTACGKKLTKNMYYAWGTLNLITCKRCWEVAVLSNARAEADK